MVKLIMGLSGSGKTKALVTLVKEAVEKEHGDIICIEKGKNLTYDIPYKVRLIHASAYDINTNVLLKGFLCGLHAGNYDITHVFIDEFYKILNDRSDEAVLQFLDWLNTFGEKEKVNFTIIATADPAAVCEGIKKYF